MHSWRSRDQAFFATNTGLMVSLPSLVLMSASVIQFESLPYVAIICVTVFVLSVVESKSLLLPRLVPHCNSHGSESWSVKLSVLAMVFARNMKINVNNRNLFTDCRDDCPANETKMMTATAWRMTMATA